MSKDFLSRLKEYYEQVGAVLRGEAEAASIFPNSSDIGSTRERVYIEFLRQHAPSKCNVFAGGFLFDMEGRESKQLDVIVTTDTTPQFNFYNRDGSGKSFSPVEGTLAVVSIKSTLNKPELEDALLGIASIPPTQSLEGRVGLGVNIPEYDDWPFKIVYESSGITGTTIEEHVANFYAAHADIPLSRRPDLIHVAGKYVLFKAVQGIHFSRTPTIIEPNPPALGAYYYVSRKPDLQGISWVMNQIQQRALASTHVMFTYVDLMNKVNR